MTRVAVAAGIALAAFALAWWLGRRRPGGPPVGDCPSRLDLDQLGFTGGGIVVFVQPTCESCAAAIAEVQASGRPYLIVESEDDRRRMGVEEVPTTVEVGPDGVVLRGWVGPLPAGVLER